MKNNENFFYIENILIENKNAVFILNYYSTDSNFNHNYYLTSYFEGVYIETQGKLLHLTSQVDQGKVKVYMNYSTINLNVDKKENANKRLFVRMRIGNEYHNQAVLCDFLTNAYLIKFGYRESYCLVAKTPYTFYFTKNLNYLLKNESDVQCKNIKGAKNELSLELKINDKLCPKEIEYQNKIQIFVIEKETQKKHYFREVCLDGCVVDYTIAGEDYTFFNSYYTGNSKTITYEWYCTINNKDTYQISFNQISKWIDYSNEYLGYTIKYFKSPSGSLLSTIDDKIYVEYGDFKREGNSTKFTFYARKKDYMNLCFQQLVLKRVNTQISYEFPIYIDEETEDNICLSSEIDLSIVEEFITGVYQFYFKVLDGCIEQEIPAINHRTYPIDQNTFFIVEQPYCIINNRYYAIKLYNDTTGNIKAVISPKVLISEIYNIRIEEDNIFINAYLQNEYQFEDITNIALLNSDLEQINIEYSAERLGDNTLDVSMRLGIKEIYNVAKRQELFIGLSYHHDDAFLLLQNNKNGKPEAIREIMKYEYTQYDEEYPWCQVETFTKKEDYCLRITDNIKSLLTKEMMVDEKQVQAKIYIINDTISKEILDNAEVGIEDVVTGRRVRGSKITHSDYIQVQVPLNTTECKSYYLYTMLENGKSIYPISERDLVGEYYRNEEYKVVLKSEQQRCIINIEEILLFENPSRASECKSILEKAEEDKKNNSEKIWLIGENYGLSARDNGLAFFEYCMGKPDLQEKVYYVTKKNNKDISRLDQYKESILFYDSPEHIYMDHLCEFYIVSHGVRDVLPSLYHNNIPQYSKPIIYLQHGVTAMKKIGMSNKSYGGMIAKFCVCSTQEKQLLINEKQFTENELIVTGFARHDNLLDSQETHNRFVWIMPTWRDWLCSSKEEFENSQFYKFYKNVLTDKELYKVLKKQGCKLMFTLHIEFEKYKDLFDDFGNDVIIISDMHQESISKLITKCSMLITDYSSIVFDVAYLQKPVGFCQFDLNEYEKGRGSYVDLRTELPGMISNTSEELRECITHYIDRDFVIDDEYVNCAKRYFDYYDRNNSERIYEYIQETREEML